LRFRGGGELFALALNPLEAAFAPTEIALAKSKMPRRKATARDFAKAIENGVDFSLGGLVPLTHLQQLHFAELEGYGFRILEPPSKAEMRQIRAIYGDKVGIYQPPENAIDIEFSPPADGNVAGRRVTIFFDNDDRPVGVQSEVSLLRVTPTVRGSR